MNDTSKRKQPQQDADKAIEDTVCMSEEGTRSELDRLLPLVKDCKDAHFTEEPTCLRIVESLQNLPPDEAPEAESPFRSVREYELLNPIGKGGMGDVYKARHRRLDRIVAIKLLNPELSGNHEAVARFEREMQAVGRLEHENIVRAIDAGEDDGTLFLAMEYVEGLSCTELLNDRGGQLDVVEACQIIQQAAAGLVCAHENGIVHRDVKPSNMMIDADGRVRLLDMGLACFNERKADARELTRDGQTMGTPDYMSPEQLRDSRNVDARADVYSLGATFYKLLTGRAPFADESHPTVASRVMAIASEDVPPIVDMRADIPTEIADLIHRMLARSVDDRIASAIEVEKILAEFLASQQQEPRIAAMPARSVPPPAVLVGFAAAAVVVAAVVFRIGNPETGEIIVAVPDDIADQVKVTARPLDKPAENISLVTGKTHALEIGSYELTFAGIDPDKYEFSRDSVTITTEKGAEVSIRHVRPDNVSAEIAGSDKEPEDTESTPPSESEIAGVTNDNSQADVINEADWQPGRGPSAAHGIVHTPAKLSGIDDWTIRPALGLGGTGAVPHFNLPAADLTPDGQYYAYYTEFDVRVVDVMTGRPVLSIPNTAEFRASGVRFSPDGNRLAIAGVYADAISICDLTGRLLQRWKNPTPHHVAGMLWTPEGKGLLFWNSTKAWIIAENGEIQETVMLPTTLTGSPDDGHRMGAIHPDGHTVVLGCNNGALCFWLLNSPNEPDRLRIVPGHQHRTTSVSYCPRGDHLVSCAADNSLFIRDGHGKIVNRLADANSSTVAWSPEGRHFVDNHGVVRDTSGATIRSVGTIAVQPVVPFWPSPDRTVFLGVRSTVHYGCGPGWRVVYHPVGRLLAGGSDAYPLIPRSATFLNDGRVRAVYASECHSLGSPLTTWTSAGRGSVERIRTPGGHPLDPAWNHGKTRFALCEYDVPTDRQEYTGQTLVKNMRNVAWNHSETMIAGVVEGTDGNRFEVSSGDDDSIQELRSGGKLYPYYNALSWSPNDRLLAAMYFVSSDDGTEKRSNLGLWTPAESGDLNHMIPLPGGSSASLTFTRDSRFVICVVTADQQPQLWCVECATGKVQATDITYDIGQNGHRPHWINETQLRYAGSLWSVDSDGQIELDATYKQPDGRIQFNGLPLDDGRFLNGAGQVVNVRAKVIDQLPVFPQWPFEHHQQGLLRFNDRLLFHRSSTNSSISVLDLKARGVAWSSLMFSDDETVTLNAAGRVLAGPADIDRYLTWIIHYPGGRQIPLSRAEFHARIGLSEPQRAVNWVLDIGGELRLPDSDEPVRRLNLTPDSERPVADEVADVRLDRIQMIADESLTHLTQFTALERLDLSHSHVRNLPDLSTLTNLRYLDLSNTNITNIDSLDSFGSLKNLRLNTTAVTSSCGGLLKTMPQLTELELSHTKVDEFLLLDLAELKQLRRLSLVGLNLSDDALDTLRQSLPDCSIELE